MRKYYKKHIHYYLVNEDEILHVKLNECINKIQEDHYGMDEMFLKNTTEHTQLAPYTEKITEKIFIWALKTTLNTLFFNNKPLEKLNTLKHKF